VRVQPKPKFHIVQTSSTRRVADSEDVYASVDPILDKIAKSGIGSLTESERQALRPRAESPAQKIRVTARPASSR